MSATTLADERVRKALGAVEVAVVQIDQDSTWTLFEALGLHGTPAFVLVDPDGKVRRRGEGIMDVPTFLTLIGAK